MRGLFISIEGIDGCGKDTQIVLLKKYLNQKGYLTKSTREPGGGRISEEIRRVLIDPIHVGMDNVTELLLFSASRAQFTSDHILPLISEGGIVISSRYYDSTTAYQGYGNGSSLEHINFLNELASQGIAPDITFYFDIDPVLAARRVVAEDFSKKDRIEQRKLDFFSRARKGFLEIAQKEPYRFKVITYRDGGVEEMHKEMIELLEPLLKEKHDELLKDDEARYKQFGIEQFS